jgi:hypothetical protein
MATAMIQAKAPEMLKNQPIKMGNQFTQVISLMVYLLPNGTIFNKKSMLENTELIQTLQVVTIPPAPLMVGIFVMPPIR